MLATLVSTYFILLSFSLFSKKTNIFWKVIIIFTLYGTYSLYNLNNYQYGIYGQVNQSNYLINLVLILNCVAIYIFLTNLFPGSKNVNFVKKFPHKYNLRTDLIYYLSLLIFAYLIHTYLSGETLLTADYGHDKSKHPLYEYSIIIPIVIYYFYRVNKFYYFAVLFFIVKTLIYGGRIEIVQLLLGLAYINTYGFKQIEHKKLLVFYLVIFLAFLIGLIRESVLQNILSGNSFFSESDNILIGFSPDIIYSSIRAIFLFDTLNIDFVDRSYSLIAIFFSSIYYDSKVDSLQQLSLFHKEYYESGGGGLIFSFIFSVGGIVALLLILVLLDLLIRNLHKYKIIYIFGIFVFAAIPRWLLYNPVILFRFVLYGAFASLIMISITKVGSNNFKRKNG